ncbi:response regulator [Rubrobacter indicoceani]|uniref:response regulator n=1 Tax=Rubrobacter indicoceani TaxID=2051957 RepID=UPI001F09BD5E|nr:response regulator [Rubrobacter indicoceani]
MILTGKAMQKAANGDLACAPEGVLPAEGSQSGLSSEKTGSRPVVRAVEVRSPEPGWRSRTILLVEDNEDDEFLAVLALGRSTSSDKVVVVRDGAEALEYLFGPGRYGEASRLPPDLILLDLKLPKVDGFEVLERLRSERSTRYLPVVVLTSSGEEHDMVRSYNLGANSYVRKPINFDHFTRTVEQLKNYWLGINESPSHNA